MLIFDAPTREYCVSAGAHQHAAAGPDAAERPQFVEASRAFAQRIMTEAANDPMKRIIYAFRWRPLARPAR